MAEGRRRERGGCRWCVGSASPPPLVLELHCSSPFRDAFRGGGEGPPESQFRAEGLKYDPSKNDSSGRKVG